MKIAAFLILFSIQFGFSQSTSYKIIAGHQLNDIKLGRSTPKKIRKILPIEFEKNSGSGIACGKYRSYRFKMIQLYNDSAGLAFEYKSTKDKGIFRFFRRPKLIRIVTHHGVTSDGLVIGTSTKKEVLNLFGQLTDSYNVNFISYQDKGIMFVFDSRDIISRIEIFPAR